MPLRLPALCSALLLLPAAAMAEGMPQLDFNNPLTTSQVVWGTIIFIVLYLLLSNFGLPRVGAVLDERAQHIASDLDAARASKARADAAVSQMTEAVAKARAEAQAAINAALEEAKQEAASQMVELNARLERQLQEAEAQIAAAHSAAMHALRDVATDTASSIIARLTGTAPDQRQLDRAIAAALAARQVG